MQRIVKEPQDLDRFVDAHRETLARLLDRQGWSLSWNDVEGWLREEATRKEEG